jgi:integrase
MPDGSATKKSEGVGTMSKRGSGSIYLRGTTWWIRYSHRGAEYRESSESDSETIARRLLNTRIKETGRRGGKFLGQAEERVRFEDLAEMLRTDYLLRNRRSTRRLEGSIKHLQGHFGTDRAVDIDAGRVKAYAKARIGQGAANATVNRELSALKHGFKIAIDDDRLSRVPKIKMLAEDNERQGFIERAEFIAVRQALPEHLRDPLDFVYLSGWRVSEMKALEWIEIDLNANEINLPPAKSKNSKPRKLPLSGELAEIIARARDGRRLDCRFVFHLEGKPILDFRGAWAAACKAAGHAGLLVHDLRRSAIRNLSRAGVSEQVAMQLSGHKTREIFRRYNITSSADLKVAVERRDQYLNTRLVGRKIVPLTKRRH